MTLAEKINAALDAGKTVKVATMTRVVPVKAKHRDAWRNAGFEFFKSDADGATLMIEGQTKGAARYACIDFARVTVA
jgi:hypothetical protein